MKNWTKRVPGSQECFEVGKQYGEYIIQLPHQCDEFVVADGSTKEKLISNAESFIKELQDAIEFMRNLPEEE